MTERGVEIEIALVPWDTRLLGHGVAEIRRISVDNHHSVTNILPALHDWLDENDVKLASCRLPSGELRVSMLLEANGFRFLEMVYRPALTLPADQSGLTGEISVADALEADLPEIREIAGSAFTTSRFLLDWRLEPSFSRRRYEYWVETSFESKQQRVLKAVHRDEIAGFFIVEQLPGGCIYWHLTAVASRYQNKGLGKQLWNEMVRIHSLAGMSRIETTISAHNTSVINLYAALQFRLGSPQMTFHWVRE